MQRTSSIFRSVSRDGDSSGISHSTIIDTDISFLRPDLEEMLHKLYAHISENRHHYEFCKRRVCAREIVVDNDDDDNVYPSRSWRKLMEMNTLVNFASGKRRILDLCSAPGSFIKYLQNVIDAADFFAVSIPSGIPMSDKVNNYTLIPGDVTDVDTQKYLQNCFAEQPPDLVLADGGFESKSGESREESHYGLIESEIDCAVSLLRAGGSAVVKFFDTHTSKTAQLLSVAFSHFEKVYLVKTRSSRARSSEHYVILENKLEERSSALAAAELQLCDALVSFNNEKAERQIAELMRIITYTIPCPPEYRSNGKGIWITTDGYIVVNNNGVLFVVAKDDRLSSSSYIKRNKLIRDGKRQRKTGGVSLMLYIVDDDLYVGDNILAKSVFSRTMQW